MRLPPRPTITVAFVLLALAGSYGLAANASNSTHKLLRAQHTACMKANELRLESNQRIRSHLILRDATEDSLSAQATARLASYKQTHQHADLVAARRAKELLHRIKTDVSYHRTPLIDC